MLYPWNVICNYLIRHGKMECQISGLDNNELEHILNQSTTTVIRNIQIRLDNPDLSDSEKVILIRNELNSLENLG